MTGCGGNNQSTDDLITVDVTVNYPKKELILQDFMDVEYIALETTDEFLTQGVMKAIGKDIILVTNRTSDGDIFIYDRTGKGINKINRRGQGGEEYTQTTQIILDENANEIFVEDYPLRKFLIYDLYGNFKRSFMFADSSYYSHVFNYDRDNLICYKRYLSLGNIKPCHIIVSKKDGSITREIQIPFKEINDAVIRTEVNGEMVTITVAFTQIIRYKGNFVLVEASSDTIYNYLSDGSLNPFIVRTPSMHSTDPEILFYPNILTDRYYFMKSLKKVANKNFTVPYGNDLVYDKQEKAIFENSVFNDDFSNKKRVNLSNMTSLNDEIATWQVLEAYQLVEAYEKGQLKDGKLKEIASKLDAEDNPVIMLIKNKK